MDFNAKEILFAILGSGTFIGALVVVFNAITTRLDARRQRLTDGEQKRITEAVEMRQLLDASSGKRTVEYKFVDVLPDGKM